MDYGFIGVCSAELGNGMGYAVGKNRLRSGSMTFPENMELSQIGLWPLPCYLTMLQMRFFEYYSIG
jgi:hypothetical protein